MLFRTKNRLNGSLTDLLWEEIWDDFWKLLNLLIFGTPKLDVSIIYIQISSRWSRLMIIIIIMSLTKRTTEVNEVFHSLNHWRSSPSMARWTHKISTQNFKLESFLFSTSKFQRESENFKIFDHMTLATAAEDFESNRVRVRSPAARTIAHSL